MIFDLIFLVVFTWAAYRGFSKGLLIQAATFAALFLGIFGAVKFSGYTSSVLIEKTSMNEEFLPVISFALTFIIIVLIVHLLSRIIEKLIQAIALGFLNRFAGAVFNMTKFALIMSGILVILNGIHDKKPFLPQQEIDNSRMYNSISRFAPLIFPYLNFSATKDIVDNIDNSM